MLIICPFIRRVHADLPADLPAAVSHHHACKHIKKLCSISEPALLTSLDPTETSHIEYVHEHTHTHTHIYEDMKESVFLVLHE